jgi:hypothetical protein
MITKIICDGCGKEASTERTCREDYPPISWCRVVIGNIKDGIKILDCCSMVCGNKLLYKHGVIDAVI